MISFIFICQRTITELIDRDTYPIYNLFCYPVLLFDSYHNNISNPTQNYDTGHMVR